MSIKLLILCVVSATLSLISFVVDRCRQTKKVQGITYTLAVISFVAGMISAWLSYQGNIETERQILRTREEAAEAAAQAEAANAQITEIRTPRRMAAQTKDMLVARLKPYAGQKYDMKVFRDEDSLELARALETIFEEAGWVGTNVYPRNGTRHLETDEQGVWTISGNEPTRRTSEAKSALDDALHEAGLYDDSTLLRAVNCAEIKGPIEVGSKVTPIPCSESDVRITGVGFKVVDNVIPGDTLVLVIGKQRL